jgi:YVTN family beta-propeller protein
VVATIPLPNPLANIAATPDGTRVYVSSPTANAVYLINTVTNTMIGTIPAPTPQGIGVTPDGTRVYVTNGLTPGVVSVIDTFTNTVTATITLNVADRPWFVRFTPDGKKAFVVCNGAPGAVDVIDTEPGTGSYNMVVDTIPAGTFPGGVGITPDGNFAYVTNGLSPQDVLVIDTSTYGIVTTIPLPGNGGFPAVVRSRAYVPLYFDTSVAVIDTYSNTVIATVAIGPSPTAAAFVPNGTKIYVTNSGSNTVSVINPATNLVVATIIVGTHPYDVAFANTCACIECNASPED